MSINEEELKKWIEQVTKKLAHLEENQMAILDGDFQSKDKPTEPLIKDEKIRKAVRAWAEANHINSVYILGVGTLRSLQNGIDIEFYGNPFSKWVTEGKTIAELCGEEEE